MRSDFNQASVANYNVWATQLIVVSPYVIQSYIHFMFLLLRALYAVEPITLLCISNSLLILAVALMK